MMFLLLLACGSSGAPAIAPGAEVWVESRTVAEGEAAVLHAPASAEIPEVEGLEFSARTVTDAGEGTWEVRGEPGSYIIPVVGTAGTPITVYLDVGVKGPSGGPMEDLVGLPDPQPPVWPWVVAGIAGAGALVAVGVLLWRRFRPVSPPPPPPPPEPADQVARREWAALRARTDLPPPELALALSAVFRRYLEAAHRWPATQRTTREILDNLAGAYTASELDSSRRLLMAMDLVKFAERNQEADVFDSLDRDFSAVVRPVRTPHA